MKNHWLNEKKNKKLSKELEDLLIDNWADDETMGQFIDDLSDDDELYEFFQDHFIDGVDIGDDGKEIIITLKRPSVDDDGN